MSKITQARWQNSNEEARDGIVPEKNNPNPRNAHVPIVNPPRTLILTSHWGYFLIVGQKNKF